EASPSSGSGCSASVPVEKLASTAAMMRERSFTRREGRFVLLTCRPGPARGQQDLAIMTEKLTHFDERGAARMVDVGGKDETHRVAVAGGEIRMQAATLAAVLAGTAKKGDVLGVARIAAIQAAKRTSELVPLCHPVPLTPVNV